jgi:hypothetical protein
MMSRRYPAFCLQGAVAANIMSCVMVTGLFFMLTSLSFGMDFSTTSVRPFGDRHLQEAAVLLKGEIMLGDYDRLVQFALHNNIDLTNGQFLLSSVGGDVSEALKIGQLVKNLYGTVWVQPDTGQCASACFIIFASAVNRHALAGLVGIHRPYLDRTRLRSLAPKNAESLENKALLDAETYLHQLRVPSYLVDKMFEHASSEIYWLSDEDLVLELGTRPAWYEEFLIARCGFDKEAELEYFRNSATPGDIVHSMLIPVEQCGTRLTRSEALENYNKIAARYGMHFAMSQATEISTERQPQVHLPEPPQIAQLTERMSERSHAAGHQSLYAALDTAVPNWRIVNEDQKFLEWLDETEPYAGETWGRLLKAAFESDDEKRVEAIFKAYLDGTDRQSSNPSGDELAAGRPRLL